MSNITQLKASLLLLEDEMKILVIFTIKNNLKAFKKITDKKGLIFKSSTGGIMTDSLPRKWMHQILNDTDLRPIKIHGFRHTHASLCFEAGMTLKQVQYRLGHSDMKTTINVYTHITKQAQDEIGEKFSNYINF